MKNYIRHQNTSFKLRNIRDLAANWLAACDKFTSTGFLSKQNDLRRFSKQLIIMLNQLKQHY